MRKLPAMMAVVSMVALGSCGGPDDPIIIKPPPQVEDPVSYFGMDPCTCYEYVSEKDWNSHDDLSQISRKLGVAVENLGAQTDFGKKLHIVRYRMEGDRVVRQDFLDPADPDLRLHGVSPTGKGAFWKLDPPLSLVRGPAMEGKLVSTHSTPTKVTPPDQEEEGTKTRFDAQYRTIEADETKKVQIGKWDEIERRFHRETVDAYPISYRGAGDFEGDNFWAGQLRWFTPERGFVKLQMRLDGKEETWVLLHTRKLAEDRCTPDGREPTDWCGR